VHFTAISLSKSKGIKHAKEQVGKRDTSPSNATFSSAASLQTTADVIATKRGTPVLGPGVVSSVSWPSGRSVPTAGVYANINANFNNCNNSTTSTSTS
jgi:hypothetical protein